MLKIQIIGHVGKDAEVKDVNGKKVINFSVAHTEKYKDNQGNQQEKTTWVDCAKWGDQTAVAQYIKKGGQVYVEGMPEIRTWESNGKSGVSFVCRVGLVQLLGGGQQQQQGTAAAAQPAAAQSSQEPVDDLPF